MRWTHLSHKIFGRKSVYMMTIIILLSSPLFASLPNKEDRGRFYEPVEISGKLLKSLVGTPIENIALFSFFDKTFRPVTFQIDELTENGDFILPSGPEGNGHLSNRIYDPQDLIVFMARHAGEKAPEGMLPDGASAISTVSLQDPLSGDTAFVYVARIAETISPATPPPVTELEDRGTPGFNIRARSWGYDGLIKDKGSKNASPTIFIDKLWVNETGGGSNENIFDRQKVRGCIRFMKGLVKVSFSEAMVKGGIIAYKEGPVRVIAHSCMYPAFPLGIKGPKFYIDSILVDSLTLTRTIMGVPFNPGAIISDITLSFGMDLSDKAKGMTYYSSETPEGLLIDGQMTEDEKAISKAKNAWSLITGPQGTQISMTVFDPNFLKNGEAFSIYNDNEKDAHPPENYKGDIGAMYDRLVLKGLSSGKYFIDTTGCIPSHFYSENGLNKRLLSEILDLQKKPLELSVEEAKTTNTGMRPREVIQTRKDS